MTAVLIVIVVLAILVLALVVGLNFWGVRTQHRDRRHMFGARSRRARRNAP